MSKVRVCFLGTPDFAVTCLRRLVEDSHFEIVGVVTQPDRPAGRKMQLTPSAVKSYALSQGLQVISPESINQEIILQEVQKWSAEVAVVVAFGQIVSTKFLNLFRYGAVNVHASVLPRWRGAAPIQRAVEAGDLETGVTLQKMVKQLDAGDIIGIRKIPLDDRITALKLHDELAVLGADLLHVELMDYVRGNLAPTPQDPAEVTYAKKIDKAESVIDWGMPAQAIHNKIRGLTMGPGTYTTLQGKKLKLHKTYFDLKASGVPGAILNLDDQKIVVGTAQGSLEIFEVQPESRNRMSVAEFLKGHSLKSGDRLGT